MFAWVESLIVLLIIAIGLFCIVAVCLTRNDGPNELPIHNAHRIQTRNASFSHSRPVWIPPQAPPRAILRWDEVSRDLVHAMASTTSPGRILTRTYSYVSSGTPDLSGRRADRT